MSCFTKKTLNSETVDLFTLQTEKQKIHQNHNQTFEYMFYKLVSSTHSRNYSPSLK